MTPPIAFEAMGPLPADVLGALREVPFLTGSGVRGAIGTPLGGVTNQSWGVIVDGRRLVVRVPREGTPRILDREAEAHNTRLMSDLGVNVPTLFLDPGTGVKVAPWLDGQPLRPEELRDPSVLPEIAGLLRRVHGSGADLSPAFRPARLYEDIESMLGHLPPDLAAARGDFRRCRDHLLSHGVKAAPCHQDLYRANFLRAGGRLYLIDWEHSGPCDPVYDLADLSVQGDLTPDEDRALLEEYFSATGDALPRERFFWAQQLSRLVWGAWALVRAETGGVDPAHLLAGRRKLALAREALRRRSPVKSHA